MSEAFDNLAAILRSSSYRLAEDDPELLRRPEMRAVRMQLELAKPELAFLEHKVNSTIVVFGSARIPEPAVARERLAVARAALAAAPDDPLLARAASRAERVAAKSSYYERARDFARLVTSTCQVGLHCDYVVVTGGGPGIMEAANRGAHDAGGKSVGLNITLLEEQQPNPYITPDLCFRFRYFALRKLHFLLRAKALVIFPGGFGTLDELFDALTLRQTMRMQSIPIVMFGREYWEQVLNLQFLADEGTISDEDLELISYAETPAAAWDIITEFHRRQAPGV
ncbi:MAG: TIGR00730 family Rossman fold protein [Pirellulales bacterium]|nr:TIGR00730 family Rossman fold protein [Pirellulales bacterium]